MATEWVELKHEVTGAVHRFPARVAAAWAARGWQPYEAPPEPPKATPKPVKTSAAPAAPSKE